MGLRRKSKAATTLSLMFRSITLFVMEGHSYWTPVRRKLSTEPEYQKLVAETGDRVRVGRDRLHDLDRASPLEVRVVGAVDQAHGPLADEILDLVLP